jgi:hypothetical protein
MKVIEKSATSLAFRIGYPYFNSTLFHFNRVTGRAIIKRVAFFFPLKQLDLALNDISSAYLGSASISSEGGEQAYPILQMKSGEKFSIPAGTESSTKKAVTAINAFLKDGAMIS